MEYPETHQQGFVQILNLEEMPEDLQDCDFGVQIASDGRVWVCVNGIALLRFKPRRRSLAAGVKLIKDNDV